MTNLWSVDDDDDDGVWRGVTAVCLRRGAFCRGAGEGDRDFLGMMSSVILSIDVSL